MLVQDVMHTPVVTAAPDDHLADTYALMQKRDIRHLPVVEGERLAGVVTDRDLRLATSRLHPHPFDPEDRLDEVMTHQVLTASPRDPVEEAARLMRAHKIGCLPVVEGEKVVGIVTGTDLLDAILRLTGTAGHSGRLVVDIDDETGQLADATAAIAALGVDIRSVLSYGAEAGIMRVIFRIETLNTPGVADALRKQGYDVTWPPHHAA